VSLAASKAPPKKAAPAVDTKKLAAKLAESQAKKA